MLNGREEFDIYKTWEEVARGFFETESSLKVGISKEEEILYFIVNSFERDFFYGIEQIKKDLLEAEQYNYWFGRNLGKCQWL